MLKQPFLCLLCLLLLCPLTALATPERAGSSDERFQAMDADKDGKVTWEEFSAHYPNMTRAAFEAIDISADGTISLEEWRAFSGGHSRERMREGGGMGGMGGMGGSMPPEQPEGQKDFPLLMPKK